MCLDFHVEASPELTHMPQPLAGLNLRQVEEKVRKPVAPSQKGILPAPVGTIQETLFSRFK
jgi:hypothetical protein